VFLYAYAGGDPVNRWDPSGLDFVTYEGDVAYWVTEGSWGGDAPRSEWIAIGTRSQVPGLVSVSPAYAGGHAQLVKLSTLNENASSRNSRGWTGPSRRGHIAGSVRRSSKGRVTGADVGLSAADYVVDYAAGVGDTAVGAAQGVKGVVVDPIYNTGGAFGWAVGTAAGLDMSANYHQAEAFSQMAEGVGALVSRPGEVIPAMIAHMGSELASGDNRRGGKVIGEVWATVATAAAGGAGATRAFTAVPGRALAGISGAVAPGGLILNPTALAGAGGSVFGLMMSMGDGASAASGDEFHLNEPDFELYEPTPVAKPYGYRVRLRPEQARIGFMTKDGRLFGDVAGSGVGHAQLAERMGVTGRLGPHGDLVAITIGKLRDGSRYASGSGSFGPLEGALRKLAAELVE
jgi:hypothetical protein